MVEKVIMIHGNGGASGDGGWFPSVAAAITKRGIPVLHPTFPDSIEAKASVWLPYIEHELGADERTILIGHSSGAVAAMRYAETHRIAGSVLVAACYTDLGEESERISGYYDRRWRWQRIRANQPWVIQFASTNDPFIPRREARYIQGHLQTEYYELSGREHFGYPTDMLEFPELLAALLPRLSS